MGARRGLEGHGGEAAYLGKARLEAADQLERTLREGVAGEGMGAAPARGRGRRLVGLGVVLHRAAAERVEIRVDGVVFLGEPREVAYDRELVQLGQRERFAREAGGKICGGDIGGRKCAADEAGARKFEGERFLGEIHSETSLSAWTSASISALEFTSVTQTSSSFGLAASMRERAKPGMMRFFESLS